MAEPILSFLLETIGTLLIEEAKFLSGVSDQARDLHLELKMVRALLKDADEKQHEAAIVKEWVSQSKDLAYEVENVLETYAFKLASKRGTGNMAVIRRYACILNECYIRHKVGLEIQSLNSRVSNLTKHFQEYGIRAVTDKEGPSSSRLQQMRMTYPYVADDEDFVGFGEDVGKLVSVLVNEDDQSFVSIYGMGGLGKTTLARKIYNHPDVKRHFDNFAWVCISQQWQERDILQEILISFLPHRREEIEKWRDGELVEQLLRFQQESKCLVVLDDIWSTNAWDCIKVAFPIQKKGNKILLTTRNNDVATRIGPNGFHHEPKLLSDGESWKLFKKKALRGRPIQEYESVQGMGEEMVKFCGGLPLAVVVLGGILATKHSFDEWNAVYRNVKSYLGKGESIEQHQGEVEKILALSYNDLPYKLKPCFLYLSVFPEDEEIEAERLYLLWMAEGMVFAEDRIGDESMLDIAERYLGELAKRCIVRVEVDNESLSTRKFYSCRLHDLMRDLCLAKAREEQFLEVTDSQNTNYDVELVNSSGASSSSVNFHRIAIYLREQEAQKYVPPKMEAAKNLRAFLFSVKDETAGNLIAQLVESQLNRFKMLRSLTVERVITPGLENLEETNSFPDDIFKLPIGHLIHLRYLSLRRSRLVISPSSMSKLEHLETLDLSDSMIAWTKNVPLRMRRLRYLNIDYLENYYNNLQIDASSSLEILVGFNSRKNVVFRNFSELTNLRELVTMMVNNPNEEEEIIKCISNSQRMKRAILVIDDPEIGIEILAQLFGSSSCFQYLAIVGRLGKLPKYDSHSLRNLLELGLESSYLEEDPMEILEKLPNLQRLFLFERAFEGKEMVCHSMGFSQLRFLKLEELSNLEKWTVEEGAMANLSRLDIDNCKRLATIPEGLRYIKSLKELVIERMPEEFQDRIRVADGQKGEDFDIVCHIPSIIFS